MTLKEFRDMVNNIGDQYDDFEIYCKGNWSCTNRTDQRQGV